VHVNRHRNWCILFAQYGGTTSFAEAGDGFRRADDVEAAVGYSLQRWKKINSRQTRIR